MAVGDTFDGQTFGSPPPRFATVVLALAVRKAEVCAIAAKLRDEKVAALISPTVSAYEAASWRGKQIEAQAYLVKGGAATDADAPTLAAEALERGVPTLDIVNRVAANAQALYGTYEPKFAGRCGWHKDRLVAIANDANLTDAAKIAAIEAYDITTGWPA